MPARRFPPASADPLNPLDLARWLQSHAAPLKERWIGALRARGSVSDDGGVEELLESFMDLLVVILPELMGPHRDQLEPIWTETAELLGSMACNRGLAAGEAVEETQIAREAILRLLYQDPPRVSAGPLGLREVLRLNRAVDQLVTHASVGHTDALFFALFQGSGVPERLSDELRYEIRAQLESLRASADEVIHR